MPEAQTYTVSALKERLDRFLVTALSVNSRTKIQREIEAGAVQVNGSPVTDTAHVVRQGDTVTYEPLPEKEIAELPSQPLVVLYDNDGLMIVDKPAGMVVHPGAGFKGSTLASLLLVAKPGIHVVGEEGRSGIVHRLDKDTSGVILVATTPVMYDYLKEAFQTRKVKKKYITLVKGHVALNHGTIDLPLGKSKRDFRKYTTDQSDMVLPKESLTEYTVLERLGQAGGLDETTLLSVELHTGRTHQIRVHLGSLGNPLMGDSLYGGKKAHMPGLSRQFLHAGSISVQMPNGTWIEAESKIPDDLRRVLLSLHSTIVNQL